jgi:pimeloyl-ACP methyl ester carboxylesterase
VAAQVQRLRHDLSLVLLAGSGHCPHDEHPAAFNGALLNWLAQLPAQEPASGVEQ